MAFPRHGHCRFGVSSPEYDCYQHAKHRCINKNSSKWEDYGGRGIRFLFSSFEEFMAELGTRPKGKTLDRIDNNGNYEVGNVRWATSKEQGNNRRPFQLDTICKNGHSMQDGDPNVYVCILNNGKRLRQCKICRRNRHRKWSSLNRERIKSYSRKART